MTDRPSGAAPSRLVAVLGPTNTGKTHLAVERMLGHASGMIGLPLRLLAREIYDRIVKLRGARAVALITGEEKILPPHPHYFVCTVEAMPLNRQVEFLAVDEIQLCADPERGHVFTQRLLHARGQYETMFLGSGAMAPLVRRLLPDCEIQTRERFSRLTYAGSKKLTRLPRRTAVVAFSADAVYAIAELIRRQRGGAAVVMGSLSPRTRNAQVALYQSGEVDFLVATDAIGMGLNMDVDHVAFSGLRKFDGRRMRWLHPHEVGQIAGRAGRYRTDGTFGVTGEAEPLDEDQVEAVENHRFEPVDAAQWRNARLDFGSLKAMMRSLAQPPRREGLKLAEESLDEKVLRQLAQDPDVETRCRNRAHLHRLWEVCQTPDFRKMSMDEHLRLVRTLFEHLTAPGERLPEDWIAGQFAGLDRADGDIDALAARLASVRTLAYAANRPDWLRDPAHWQGKTRALEDRLSDVLHERLMQRFIDRRTSALLRGLQQRADILAGVGDDGAVTVEGHSVGRLRGLRFEPVRGGSALEDKALRAAAERVVGPELGRRMGRLAAEPDDAFALQPGGVVSWRGEAAGQIVGEQPFAPQVRLFAELGPEAAKQRAVQRLEAFVAAEAGRKLKALRRLEGAVKDGALKGLARGVAWRLVEAGGMLDRTQVESDIRALSQAERRSLQSFGVRFGAFTLFLPALLRAKSLAFSAAFGAVGEGAWRPAPGRIVPLPPRPPLSPRPGAAGAARCRRLGGSGGGAGAAGQPPAHGAAPGWRVGADRSGAGNAGLEPGRGAGRAAGPRLCADRQAQGRRTSRLAQADVPARNCEAGSGGFALRRPGRPQTRAGRSVTAAQTPPATARRGDMSDLEGCRLDVWLWRARFFKTRALAARFLDEGRMRLVRPGLEPVRVDKPSRAVKPGDALLFALGGHIFEVKVEALGERRGPASEARSLYSAPQDH